MLIREEGNVDEDDEYYTGGGLELKGSEFLENI